MSIKGDFLQSVVERGQETPEFIQHFLAEYYDADNATIEGIATASFPPEFVRLRDSADFYEEECRRAKLSGAYLSACLMATAALECLLLMLAYLHEDEIAGSQIFVSRKHQFGKPSISQLQLNELISIAITYNWLSTRLVERKWHEYFGSHRDYLTKLSQSESGKARKLPDEPAQALMRFMQNMRNSVHGSRFVRLNLSPERGEMDQACRIAVEAYEELKEILLVQLARNMSKIKVNRTKGLASKAKFAR